MNVHLSRAMNILEKEQGVNRSNCVNYMKEELTLPGDTAYAAETQLRTKLAAPYDWHRS